MELFRNNEKTIEHSDHWIMTEWHGEQWDFQNNEKTMKHSVILITGHVIKKSLKITIFHDKNN